MQIHELNNFTGTLGSGSYIAIDDGNDTGKISKTQLFAATEARIDNIIAGPAPSAEEIVDARLGDDGVTYPSLGDAIRDQVSDLKADLNYDKSATPGYILTATNSGHGTQWSPVGLPSDEQTAQAVTDWLDAHPEATTTVQDGSLTEAKFTDALKLKTIKDYVTPQMFGAKGDGVTDDTDAIQAAINSGSYVLIPYGTYLVSRTIVVNTGVQGSLSFVGMGSEILGNPPTDRPRKVIIKAASSFTGTEMFSLNGARNCYFANFSAECGRNCDSYVMGGSTTINNCFLLTNSPYNKFEGINFKGANGAAFKVVGTTYTNSFINCAFSASDKGYDSHECADHCTTWFYNCRFEGNETVNLLITGRMIAFYGCAFEGGLGDGVQIGYSGISTYDIAFYSCDIEGNYGYAMKFNTNVQEITYDCGQIIGKSDCNNNLFYINSALDNVNFMTHMAVLNSNKVIYDPTGMSAWIRGYFPDAFMNCIHVGNIFWSPLGSKKRENYVDYTFTTDDISDIIPASGSHGAVATISKGFKLQIGGKAVSKITGVVSPVPASGKLLVKYHRGYNGGDKTAVNNCIATVAADGTFTLDSSIGVWGMMDSIFICPTWAQGDTNTYNFTNLVGKLR